MAKTNADTLFSTNGPILAQAIVTAQHTFDIAFGIKTAADSYFNSIKDALLLAKSTAQTAYENLVSTYNAAISAFNLVEPGLILSRDTAINAYNTAKSVHDVATALFASIRQGLLDTISSTISAYTADSQDLANKINDTASKQSIVNALISTEGNKEAALLILQNAVVAAQLVVNADQIIVNDKTSIRDSKQTDYNTYLASYNTASSQYTDAYNQYLTAIEVEGASETSLANARIALTQAIELKRLAILSASVAFANAVITEGIIEFHKSIQGTSVDEIIGYSTLDNRGNVLLNYKLVDNGAIQFYALFKNSINYNDNQSDVKSISVFKQLDAFVTSPTLNPSYKLAQSIALNYSVVDSYGASITEGIFEIHKVISGSNIDVILAYVPVNQSFNYILVDVGQIAFYVVYKNSVNYKDITTTSQLITINKQFNSVMTKTSDLVVGTNYKLGDVISLSYLVTDNSSVNVTEGIIEFHKYNYDSGIDKVLAFALISAGIASITTKIIDLGDILYYGKFNNSFNYQNNRVDNNKITVISQYDTITTLVVSSSSIKYGDTVSLVSSVTSSSTINQGIVEFYVTIGSGISQITELIGTQTVSSGSATMSYVCNDIGSIQFYSLFKNSIDYALSQSTSSTVIVSKQDPVSFVLTIPATKNYLSIVSIPTTLTFNQLNVTSYTGKVTYTVTNKLDTTMITVDVTGNVAVLSLYLANLDTYTIKANFDGNDIYNTVETAEQTFTPTLDESVYSNVHYSVSGSVYQTVTATLNLSSPTLSNKFILNNTGYFIFTQKFGSSSVNTITVPCENGTATAIMRNDSQYSFTVTYSISSFSLTGSLV